MSKRLRSCAAGGLLSFLALGPGAIRAPDYPSGPMRIGGAVSAGGHRHGCAHPGAEAQGPLSIKRWWWRTAPARTATIARRWSRNRLRTAHHAARPIGLRVEPDPDEKPALRSARDLAPVSSLASGPMVLVVASLVSGEIGQGADRIPPSRVRESSTSARPATARFRTFARSCSTPWRASR